VSQEPTLPPFEVTQEELERVCRDAKHFGFHPSMFPPPGYVPDIKLFHSFETEVGSKGSQLSGGQKRMCRHYFKPSR
jgi:ATP-binding cassette subfamily B (MDR/TAP) protein 1